VSANSAHWEVPDQWPHSSKTDGNVKQALIWRTDNLNAVLAMIPDETPGGLDQFIVALSKLGSHDPAQFAATAGKHGSTVVGSNLGTKLGLTK
jgi:hypothetical protein